MYETCAQDLITQLMNGFNGTLLAYGETGAGEHTFIYMHTHCMYHLRIFLTTLYTHYLLYERYLLATNMNFPTYR